MSIVTSKRSVHTGGFLMYFMPSFEQYLEGIALEELSHSDDVTYIIDQQFRLQAYNEAWVRFARDNEGEKVLKRFILGTPILDGFCQEARLYYEYLYRKAMITSAQADHEFQCSSHSTYRRFHQTAYVLKNRQGLTITNRLIEEHPFPEAPLPFSNRYLATNGYILECAHCRKVQNQRGEKTWDWVPYLIKHPVPNIAHTFCPTCCEVFSNPDTHFSA